MTDGAGATDGYSALRNDVTLGSRIFGPASVHGDQAWGGHPRGPDGNFRL